MINKSAIIAKVHWPKITSNRESGKAIKGSQGSLSYGKEPPKRDPKESSHKQKGYEKRLLNEEESAWALISPRGYFWLGRIVNLPKREILVKRQEGQARARQAIDCIENQIAGG